jgi:exopolysaccharide production protein ExoQ
MSPHIAAIVFIVGILGLFVLDRDRMCRTSTALWIPVVWLLITGSRPLSQWLQIGPTIDSPDKYLDGSPIDRNVLSILLFMGLVVLISRWQLVIPLLRSNWPILLFFFYCAMSVFWSDYSFVAFKRWTRSVGALVMVLVVLTDSEPEAALKQLLARVGFLLVPLSVLFIKYYPDLGRGYNPWTWVPTYCGVTTNKNELGMICLIFGLASLWRVLDAYRDRDAMERTRWLMAHGAILAMVFWLLWMANSMTSLLCLILTGCLMITILLRAARQLAFVHFLVVAMICAALIGLSSNLGSGMVESLGRDSTLTGRTRIWNMVLDMDRSPVFGTGFESFWLGDRLQTIWDTYEGLYLQEAHNGYLEVYLNLGWVGVTLLALVIVTGYRNVVALFRSDPDQGRISLPLLVAVVLFNLTESAFGGSALWIIFLLAIMVVPKAPVPRGPSPVDTDHTAPFTKWEPSSDSVPSIGVIQNQWRQATRSSRLGTDASGSHGRPGRRCHGTLLRLGDSLPDLCQHSPSPPEQVESSREWNG